MKIIQKKYENPFSVEGVSIENILTLIKNAYVERLKEGIVFLTLNYSIAEYEAELNQEINYFFVAIDTNNTLYGVARLILREDYAYLCNFAVSPEVQGKHVGSMLLQYVEEFAKERGLSYIRSFTAVKATSSVKCHLRNGFCIVGCHYSSGGYWSYAFRNQIRKHWLWSNHLYCKLRYAQSYMWRHLKHWMKWS